MKVTAADLLELGIIEKIIPEETAAGEHNLDELAEYMKIQMKRFLKKQAGKTEEELTEQRYERFRRM